LYQINTRVTLTALDRSSTLDDFPDSELDRIAGLGFDWVWFLGVWQTGPAGRTISVNNPEWQREYRHLLSDFQDADVCGSCFAIQSYTVHKDFGGNDALARLRSRIHARGMRLLLDFVPNHMAPDHAWAVEQPQFFVHGSEELLAREPQNYVRIGEKILAYGRDPYFSGWPDTLQLNYAEPCLQEAMARELERIATMCDGVRCDMAMLILPDVFERTWGKRPEHFWPRTIERVKRAEPSFLFMAEVYWDLEWELQQQGFDYTYDKRLYDRLVEGHARPVRDHFRADMAFQQRSARFLENHDEPRAASTFDPLKHEAAAILTFLCPGLRFIHQGQMEGFTRRIPVHLGRGPAEGTDAAIRSFYEKLLGCVHRIEARNGEWMLLDADPAWDDNWTSDCFICSAWQGADSKVLLSMVNYAPNQSQCYVRLPFGELAGKTVRLKDLMGHEVHDRSGNDLLSRGLYLDVPAWGYNVFELTTS
jgi:hypothetical protein